MKPSKVKHETRSREIKNYKCIYYQTCLDIAAKLNWYQFTCHECEHRDTTVELDILEILPDQDGVDWSISKRFIEGVET